MSIKGIDNQIMVHRVTEYSRDASVQNKRNEFAQLMQGHLGKVQQEHDKKQVQSVALEAKINPVKDDQGRNGRQQPDSKKKKKPSNPNQGGSVDILV